MGRILFFLVLAAVAWIAYKSWARKRDGNQPPRVPKGAPGSLNSNEKEAIYPCKHCGAYSPLSSGVMVEGRFYCGLAHAKAEGEKVQ